MGGLEVEGIIREIARLGHEIGYHYECLAACNGNPEQAYDDFKANLARLRTLAPVSTICMHGSPLSSIDNLDLWKTCDYRCLGILAKPHLDIDYNEVFYIADTGRNGMGMRSRSGIKSEVNPVKYASLRLRLFHRASKIETRGIDSNIFDSDPRLILLRWLKGAICRTGL